MTIILDVDDLSNGFLEDEDFSMWAMSAAQVLHQIGQSKVCVLGENKMQQAYML